MKRLGALATNLATLVVASAIAIYLAELATRYLAPQLVYRFPQGLFISDEPMGYRLAKRFSGKSRTAEFTVTIATNADGFRESREYGRKPDKTVRIVALGDSFTMGVGVEQEETIAKVLEKLLSGDPTTNFEVINAGVPGYSTWQAVEYLERISSLVDPDVVILNFFVGNDVRENYVDLRLKAMDGYLVFGPPPEGWLPNELRSYLARNSHLYNLLWPLQRKLRDPRAAEWAAMERQEYLAAFLTDSAEMAEVWAPTERALERFKELSRELGFKPAMVVIPDVPQVLPARWQEYVEVAELEADSVRPDGPNLNLVRLGRVFDIPVLDLLPTILEDPNPQSLYFPLDQHWTVEGTEKMAGVVQDFLLSDVLTATKDSNQMANSDGS